MKNYSRVLSKQSLDNIDLLKLASEASQENFEKIVFLTTKYVQIVKSEHLLCPKVGGGGGAQTHLSPPTFESGEARAPLPPLLLRPCDLSFTHLISHRNTACHWYTHTCITKGVTASVDCFDWLLINYMRICLHSWWKKVALPWLLLRTLIGHWKCLLHGVSA